MGGRYISRNGVPSSILSSLIRCAFPASVTSNGLLKKVFQMNDLALLVLGQKKNGSFLIINHIEVGISSYLTRVPYPWPSGNNGSYGESMRHWSRTHLRPVATTSQSSTLGAPVKWNRVSHFVETTYHEVISKCENISRKTIEATDCYGQCHHFV